MKDVFMETVEEIMTKNVITCAQTDSILDVQKLMIKHNINRVVINSLQNRPVGIITQKDVVNFLIVDKSRRGIEEIKVKEVMSKNLISVKPTNPINSIAKIMMENSISSLTIINDKGKLCGITTKSDITTYFAYKGSKGYKVQDFMTSKPVTIRPSQPTFLAAYSMAENKISRVVVVDGENKPLGIITLNDMTTLSNLLKPAKILAEGKALLIKASFVQLKSVHLLTAGDIMTAQPITVKKNADLTSAAKLMARKSISGLPVTDDDGKLVGIITQSDITRAVASLKQ
jgi:CBS domain-containing protein